MSKYYAVRYDNGQLVDLGHCPHEASAMFAGVEALGAIPHAIVSPAELEQWQAVIREHNDSNAIFALTMDDRFILASEDASIEEVSLNFTYRRVYPHHAVVPWLELGKE